MKHAFTLAALALMTTAGTAAIAQTYAAPQTVTSQVGAFTHPQSVQADLAQLSKALNYTGTLRGRFVQTGQDGRTARGNLYLKRPGKIRFEYDAPNPMLIVSDGVTIMQSNKALGTSDRIPLKSTPLDFFLKSEVSLERDTNVLGLQKRPDGISVTVQDKSGRAAGQMTMTFNPQNFALTRWNVLDEFGTSTTVDLTDLVYNQEIDPALFILENNKRDRRRR